ncbi:hypothetical protein Sjap_013645 [Stephania japonica]|uniref:Glycosyl transferase family 1 domain-containing protein n=1 Tax=Stephania japonica TaxID=461633 RepID=A0AAP0NYT3_9MAGN
MARTSPSSDADANEEQGLRKPGYGSLVRRIFQSGSQRDQADDDRRPDRQSRGRSQHGRGFRKGFSIKVTPPLCCGVVVFLFALMVLLMEFNMVPSFRSAREEKTGLSEELMKGASLWFVPKVRRSHKLSDLDRYLRSRREEQNPTLRKPRLAIILGKMDRDPLSMKLFTVLKSLKELQYKLVMFAVKDGKARPYWEQIGGRVFILSSTSSGLIDCFEGVIASSLEAKKVIPSLLQDPFCSVPLIWIIGEDALAERFPLYLEMGLENLIVEWKNSFRRADVVVFSDFSLPMLYSMLDTGNFFVIPGSPIDTWSAETYLKSHPRFKPRVLTNLVVVVVGSTFFYDKVPLDNAVAMGVISPLLMKFTKPTTDGSSRFIFLCGNSTDGYSEALQEVASSLHLPHGSLMHYGLDGDANHILRKADVVLHGSFRDEQGFPPLLLRAMSFGVPVIAPDLPIIKKYIVDGFHGLLYEKHNPDELMQAFSILVSGRGLSKRAHRIAAAGKFHAKNMLASECITGYAQLLENLLQFPSDVSLPFSRLNRTNVVWEWSFLGKGPEQIDTKLPLSDTIAKELDVVHALEEKFAALKSSENETDIEDKEHPTSDDWDILSELQKTVEHEMQEIQELEERMERPLTSWDTIYNVARKAQKKTDFETNERDEGELERIGQPFCIYEIYDGAGTWPFLHHGSLYRGLSLSARALRSTSDDVDAVSRLPLLNNAYYKDLLCELGGMFAIANKVDNVHAAPWIGFQSWHATAKKISLSEKAEKVLEETIPAKTEDVIYYWARLEINRAGSKYDSTFWSLCEILNADHCRSVFENAFRHMYSLPEEFDALPPMPEDGHWSALHSWLMPTPSFLEFMMFSRMFVDSLDSLNIANEKSCVLGISEAERKHCFCRMLEILVNVWAYHSYRKMVYIDPVTGSLEEQHPFKDRKGPMWVKFFDFAMLKSMDEDLAEAADDQDYPREGWLWPQTGEVYCQAIYEREREERYRLKMDKKKKAAEKEAKKQKFGKKQQSLGG